MLYDAASKTAYTGTLPQDKPAAKPEPRPTLQGVQQGLANLTQGVDALRRAADDHRRPAELHGADRAQGRRRAARRGRGRVGRGARRAAARGDLRAGLRPAGARARGDRHLLRQDPRVPDLHYAARGREGDRDQPAVRRRRAGQADARRGRGRGAQGARLPARRAGQARRAAAQGRQPRRLRQGEGRARHLRRRVSGRSPSSSIAAAENALPKGFTLPQVNIDGATGNELATALGTVVFFTRDGITYLVAGSVPPVAAENAARGLK